MLHRILFIFAFFLSNILSGYTTAPCDANIRHDKEKCIEKKHIRSSVDNAEVLEKITPYLLPEDHDAASALKKIFSKKGVLSSLVTLEEAGFQSIFYREGRGILIVRHPELKNYLVKLYLDNETFSEWTRWARRVRGARFIQSVLDENKRKYRRYFKVPRKWIYILPKDKRGDVDYPRESVLLVDDMNLVDKETIRTLYNVLWTYKGLDALYVILKKTGYSDGHIDNLPFTTDHKIAFIDTELTNRPSVHFDWLTIWFSETKQPYWEALIENGGPAS